MKKDGHDKDADIIYLKLVDIAKEINFIYSGKREYR